MATKRMFDSQVVKSDAFMTMPISSQGLYFHLCMIADDDGITNNVEMLKRSILSTDDDLQILLDKRFVLEPLNDKRYVIKHWHINNHIRSDRYKPTTHIDIKKLLHVKENNSYTLDKKKSKTSTGTTYGTTIGTTSGIRSIVKNSIEENRIVFGKNIPSFEDVLEYAKTKCREDAAKEFFDYFNELDWIDTKGNPIKNWKSKFLNWIKQTPGKSSFGNDYEVLGL